MTSTPAIDGGDGARQYSYDVDAAYACTDYDVNARIVGRENRRSNQSKPHTILSGEVRYESGTDSSACLTAGVKGSRSKVNNTLRLFEQRAGEWEQDHLLGYDFAYTGKQYAAYLKFRVNRTKWSMTVGLRGEYDRARTRGYRSAYSHFDLFSSVYCTYRVGAAGTLSLSYARRTQRISYSLAVGHTLGAALQVFLARKERVWQALQVSSAECVVYETALWRPPCLQACAQWAVVQSKEQVGHQHRRHLQK